MHFKSSQLVVDECAAIAGFKSQVGQCGFCGLIQDKINKFIKCLKIISCSVLSQNLT